MKLFILIDGELKLYRDEILLYPKLAAIYTRDKGSPGDSDGRKKLQAWKEFKYIYFMADYSSYCSQNGYSDEEAHKYAVEECGFDKEWVPDKVILDAMNFYYEHNQSTVRDVGKELITSFSNSTKVIKRIREETTKLLDKTSLTTVEINQLVDTQKAIMDMASKLPAQLKSLHQIQELIITEELKGVVGRGGEIVSESQDPDRAVS